MLRQLLSAWRYRRRKHVTPEQFLRAWEADLGRHLDPLSATFIRHHPVTVNLANNMLQGRLRYGVDPEADSLVYRALSLDLLGYADLKPSENTPLSALLESFIVNCPDAGRILDTALVQYMKDRPKETGDLSTSTPPEAGGGPRSDYGLFLQENGLSAPSCSFYDVPVDHLSVSEPGLFTFSNVKAHGPAEYCVSFDFPELRARQLVALSGAEKSTEIWARLKRTSVGGTVDLSPSIRATLHTHPGEVVVGASGERFIPFVVDQVA